MSFENLRFEPTDIDHVINDGSTNATSAENVNQLLVNNCESTYFDFNKVNLISIAKEAAVLNLDLLLLDD